MPEYWVFGYGSLMWRPGFSYLEKHPARVHGWHRRLCIYSHVHRGTAERPGLVFGLDRGGSCWGMAFRVAPDDWAATVDYLREREQVTAVYLERMVSVDVGTPGGRVRREAITYVADNDHHQYAGRLDHDQMLAFARQGEGVSGTCRDYVAGAAQFLRQADWRDLMVERLHRALEKDH